MNVDRCSSEAGPNKVEARLQQPPCSSDHIDLIKILVALSHDRSEPVKQRKQKPRQQLTASLSTVLLAFPYASIRMATNTFNRITIIEIWGRVEGSKPLNQPAETQPAKVPGTGQNKLVQRLDWTFAALRNQVLGKYVACSARWTENQGKRLQIKAPVMIARNIVTRLI